MKSTVPISRPSAGGMQTLVLLAVAVLLAGSSRDRPALAPKHDVPAADPRDSVMLDTDECGRVSSVQRGRSVLGERHVSESLDDEDQDGGGTAWDMSDSASQLEQEWALEHPELAIVTEALQKYCNDGTVTATATTTTTTTLSIA